jgi:hypothetical protein
VTLKDGREFYLEDSNDVDAGNRGIFVEDARFSRVLVSWDAFERIDFSDPAGSGPPYGSFGPGKPLRGKVSRTAGQVVRGRIVYDLDESETWELLDGEWREISYAIPFGMVSSIVPQGRTLSQVVLKNGETLELEGMVDVGENNAGLAVLDSEEQMTYIPWKDVERIDFEG